MRLEREIDQILLTALDAPERFYQPLADDAWGCASKGVLVVDEDRVRDTPISQPEAGHQRERRVRRQGGTLLAVADVAHGERAGHSQQSRTVGIHTRCWPPRDVALGNLDVARQQTASAGLKGAAPRLPQRCWLDGMREIQPQPSDANPGRNATVD